VSKIFDFVAKIHLIRHFYMMCRAYGEDSLSDIVASRPGSAANRVSRPISANHSAPTDINRRPQSSSAINPAAERPGSSSRPSSRQMYGDNRYAAAAAAAPIEVDEVDDNELLIIPKYDPPAALVGASKSRPGSSNQQAMKSNVNSSVSLHGSGGNGNRNDEEDYYDSHEFHSSSSRPGSKPSSRHSSKPLPSQVHQETFRNGSREASRPSSGSVQAANYSRHQLGSQDYETADAADAGAGYVWDDPRHDYSMQPVEGESGLGGTHFYWEMQAQL
jgi:hypothetical protein